MLHAPSPEAGPALLPALMPAQDRKAEVAQIVVTAIVRRRKKALDLAGAPSLHGGQEDEKT
jgi:hypothetical protein